jgi:predicted nucleotidyltransferase
MKVQNLPPSLCKLRDDLAAYVNKHPIRRLEVFGSAARGETNSSSDVDLLVTPSREVTTAELLEMAGEAEELAGRRVDFVLRENIERSPNPYARAQILGSAVLLHGS